MPVTLLLQYLSKFSNDNPHWISKDIPTQHFNFLLECCTEKQCWKAKQENISNITHKNYVLSSSSTVISGFLNLEKNPTVILD